MEIKNKILKYILSFIFVILAILIIPKSSQAVNVAGYGNGGIQVSCMPYNIASDVCVMGLSGNDTYCIYRGAPIYFHTNYYTKYYVHIDGNKSDVYSRNGTTYLASHTSQSNLIMAWILNQGDSGSEEGNYSPKQKAIYGYIDTWKNVNGLDLNTNSGGYSNQDWVNQATNYAQAYVAQQNANVEITSNQEDIKVDCVTQDGKDYAKVGPYKVKYTGKIEYANAYDQNNNVISAKFARYKGTDLVASNNPGDIIKNDTQFFLLIPADGTVEKITKFQIGVTSTGETIKADIWAIMKDYTLSADEQGSNQNLITTSQSVEPRTTNDSVTFDKEIEIIGDLKVVKVNKDNEEVKLKGVTFIFQNKTSGKYLTETDDGKTTYVENKENAKVYTTDENGEIKIEKIVVGTYYAYELENPNYGYEMPQEGMEVKVVVKKDTPDVLGNKQILVKISGYVWEDIQHISKEAEDRNDLYKDGTKDVNDILMSGVPVRLKDKSGNIIQQMTTDENGAYLFVDVEIEQLQNYYIEFEYDGLIYTNVIVNLDKDNGSKSSESENDRNSFNEKFSVIENKSENNGQTRDANGNIVYNDLVYDKDETNHKSSLNHEQSGTYNIVATTDSAGYIIKDHFTYGMEEIKYINLGVYRRSQPDMSVMKDVENAIVSINGYYHVYNYSNRYANQSEYEQGLNIGVKFAQDRSGQSYTRAIYKSDADYQGDASKQLNVAVTYRIRVINECERLKAKANTIADYYDSRYTIKAVGTGIDVATGRVTGSLNHTEESYSGEYTKTIISTDSIIEPSQYLDIYVQFEMNREQVANILYKETEPLNNFVEINSYSTYDTNGKIYAGIDTDSAPGNITPGNSNTYEDDTDKAPAFVLELTGGQGERTITGNVFEDLAEDSTSGGAGIQYLGNGIFDENEKGITNVQVTLEPNNSTDTTNGVVSGTDSESKDTFDATVTVTTDAEGNYTISGFVPNEYKIKFTWGDDTYTVQNYKGTTQPEAEWQRKLDNPETWYETLDPRYTDALDDWAKRVSIDNNLTEITNGTRINRTGNMKDAEGNDVKMNAYTAKLNCFVEYGDNSTTTVSDGDYFETAGYTIQNIDYGIIKRASQDLALNKQVDTIKLTLANGQVMIDATINHETNKLEGQTTGLKYFPPEKGNTSHPNGQIYIELDDELIQGSALEVGYKFSATNISDLDYTTAEYYNFAVVPEDGNHTIQLTPSGVIDYLDTDWGYDETKNTNWEEWSLENLKSKAENDKLFDKAVYGESSLIINRRILYTEALAKKLSPEETVNTTLIVSKILATAEEIDLDNETEIIKVDKTTTNNETTGGDLISIPGDYIPGTVPDQNDSSAAETVTVSSPTGADILSIIMYTGVTIIALVILGLGIILIKRKVLNDKK